MPQSTSISILTVTVALTLTACGVNKGKDFRSDTTPNSSFSTAGGVAEREVGQLDLTKELRLEPLNRQHRFLGVTQHVYTVAEDVSIGGHNCWFTVYSPVQFSAATHLKMGTYSINQVTIDDQDLELPPTLLSAFAWGKILNHQVGYSLTLPNQRIHILPSRKACLAEVAKIDTFSGSCTHFQSLQWGDRRIWATAEAANTDALRHIDIKPWQKVKFVAPPSSSSRVEVSIVDPLRSQASLSSVFIDPQSFECVD